MSPKRLQPGRRHPHAALPPPAVDHPAHPPHITLLLLAIGDDQCEDHRGDARLLRADPPERERRRRVPDPPGGGRHPGGQAAAGAGDRSRCAPLSILGLRHPLHVGWTPGPRGSPTRICTLRRQTHNPIRWPSDKEPTTGSFAGFPLVDFDHPSTLAVVTEVLLSQRPKPQPSLSTKTNEGVLAVKAPDCVQAGYRGVEYLCLCLFPFFVFPVSFSIFLSAGGVLPITTTHRLRTRRQEYEKTPDKVPKAGPFRARVSA